MSIDVSSVFSSLAIGSAVLLIYSVISFYQKVRRFPSGPTPLPFVGNILSFRSNKHVHEIFSEMGDKFSPAFTIYLAHKPVVVITDSKVGVEAMRKAAFAGRPDYGISDVMFKGDSTDVFFSDFTRQWEILKKMSHLAIKKYTDSERHPRLVAHTVDRIFDLKTEKADGLVQIDGYDDLTLMMNAILASAAFGKEYEFHDPEFVGWKLAFERQRVGSGKLVLIFLLPILKHVFRDQWQRFQDSHHFQEAFVDQRFDECEQSFDGSTVSNFCQAVIAAKQEAEAEDKDCAKFMTRDNMRNVVFDLFFAGTDTTKQTLSWIFLLMCKHPELQAKVREEIVSVVGSAADGIPRPKHRDECHFTMAFISESMRFRSIIPNGVPHKTTAETEVAGKRLPKGTLVIHPNHRSFRDPVYFPNAESFDPQRFLRDGKFTTQPFPYFTPFGVGRRSCPGNHLALLTMFLVVARLMQRSDGLSGRPLFELKGGNESVGTGGQKRGAQWNAEQYVMRLTPSPQ